MHRTQNPTGPAADTDNAPAVTPAHILRGAAHYLETHGWTRGHYYDPADTGPFPPACADGAIAMAAYGYCHPISCDNATDPGYPDYTRAVDHLIDYLDHTHSAPTIDPVTTDDMVIEFGSDHLGWNDNPRQSAEQVITTLRAAADDYERTHGGAR